MIFDPCMHGKDFGGQAAFCRGFSGFDEKKKYWNVLWNIDVKKNIINIIYYFFTDKLLIYIERIFRKDGKSTRARFGFNKR